MNTNIITPPIWLQLSGEERRILRELLKIPRSGGTIMDDNKLTSDGCTQNDLNTITVKSLQAALDSVETDFFSLWTEAVDTAKSIAKGKENERELEARQAHDNDMLKDADAKATVFMSTVRKMPVTVQLAIYSQLEALLFPPITKKIVKEEVKEPVVVTDEEIKNIINEPNEQQTESTSDVGGDEAKGKGSKKAKGAGKE